MALTTITLTSSGRWPGTSTSSTNVLINSGVIAIIPYKTSATVNKVSCMGSATARGRIGVPAGTDYVSVIKVKAASDLYLTGVGYIQNEDGTHKNPRGGGAY